MNFNHHEYVRKISGDSIVYPGHPLVVALIIMNVFENFASATEMNGGSYNAALSSSDVPGAGDHVHAAISALKLGRNGASADEVIQYANNYWTRGNAGGHSKNLKSGQEQSAACEAFFREKLKTWITAEPKMAAA